MELQLCLPILVVFLSTYKLAGAQNSREIQRLDDLAGNIDLPEMGYGDQGQPLKRCKDIWTICGIWSVDRNPWKRPCCRSEGENSMFRCRHPKKLFKEFASGFSGEHMTYCLPREGKMRRTAQDEVEDGHSGPNAMYSPRGETASLAQQEILEQLTRIADLLETASKNKKTTK